MISREYRNARFLIIDSQPEARLTLERILKSLSAWYIDVAVNGEQAIEKCQNGLFDVVICEFHLEGRNGQNVLEELRERKILRYTSIFVMVSSQTTREMVLAAIDHQPDAYITKPIQADVLQKRLDSLLIDNEVLYEIRHAMDMNRISEAINRCEEKIFKGSRFRRWCEKAVADLYLRGGEYGEALRVYRNVLEEKPLLWAQIGVARVYMATARHQEAEELLRKVVKDAPNCLLAADLLAELLRENGMAEEAQAVVREAVRKSPSAIRRQALLGSLSWEIHDVDTATEAYRNAVELGEHSVYDCPENYVGFARSLCEKSESLPRELREVHAREALAILERAERKHGLEGRAGLQRSVLNAKLYQRLHDEPGVEEALLEAERLYQEQGLEVHCDDSLEYAETLLNNGRDLQAEFVLSQVSLLHGDDEKVKKRVAQIREEPVSAGARQRAAELNRSGIRTAETGDLDKAVEIFREALEYSPRHPALNLNLVQVLLRHLETGGAAADALDLAKSCLERLGNLSEESGQYARFQHLKRKVESIT